MTSFHYRFFRRNRFGHFYGRGPKARRYLWLGVGAFAVLGGIGLALLRSGQYLAGQIVLGALAILMIIYNGFRATRPDE